MTAYDFKCSGAHCRTSLRVSFSVCASRVAPRSRAETAAEFYARTNVRLLISADPGGSYDTTARLVGRHLGSISGQTADHPRIMAGASGRVAANYMYNVAPRDGSVIAIVQQSVPMGQATGESNVQYDAARFNWIGSPIRLDDVLVVWHAAGVRTIEDAKKKEIVIGATTATGTNYIYPNSSTSWSAPNSRSSPATRARPPSCSRSNATRSRATAPIRGATGGGAAELGREKKIIPLMQMSLTGARSAGRAAAYLTCAERDRRAPCSS